MHWDGIGLFHTRRSHSIDIYPGTRTHIHTPSTSVAGLFPMDEQTGRQRRIMLVGWFVRSLVGWLYLSRRLFLLDCRRDRLSFQQQQQQVFLSLSLVDLYDRNENLLLLHRRRASLRARDTHRIASRPPLVLEETVMTDHLCVCTYILCCVCRRVSTQPSPAQPSSAAIAPLPTFPVPLLSLDGRRRECVR